MGVSAGEPRGRLRLDVGDVADGADRRNGEAGDPDDGRGRRVPVPGVRRRVFFLGVLRPEQARAHLAWLTGMSREDHGRPRRPADSVDRDDDNLSVHGRIAPEHVPRFDGMRQEWAEWAAEQTK